MGDQLPGFVSSLRALAATESFYAVALDTEGLVVWANNNLVRTVGCEPEDVADCDWFDLLSTPDQRDAMLQRLLDGEESTTHEGALHTGAGEQRPVAWTTVPRHGPDGSIVGVMSVGKDATRLRQAEQATTEAMRELSRQKAALDEHAIVAITDRRGRISYANDKFCEISGYRREELLGEDHRILNSGYHPASFFGELWETIGQGKTWRGEICNRAKDGSHYWVDTTIVPFTDAAGRIEQYVAIRAEITERKRHEQQLSLLASIVDASDDAIIREDLDGRIRSWNPAATRTYGYAAAEVLGQPIEMLLSEEARELELERRTRRQSIQTVHRTKSGRAVDVSLTVSPIHDAEGQLVGWARIARDVTELKQMHKRLTQAAKLAALGELAGNVAHEVNNPIGIIGGKARLLLTGKDPLPDKVARELNKIVQQSDRVGRLTHGLLDYCRPSFNPRQPTDAHAPLLKALSFVESMAKRLGVEVERDLAEFLPTVHANSNELEQIFLNLFLNAIDAMSESGGRLTAHTRVDAPDAHGRTVAISVRDTGSGISPEVLPRIFEPFFTTKAGKGTGLGLAICYGLVGSHDGELTVSSGPGEGTEFTVRLPAMEEAT